MQEGGRTLSQSGSQSDEKVVMRHFGASTYYLSVVLVAYAPA